MSMFRSVLTEIEDVARWLSFDMGTELSLPQGGLPDPGFVPASPVPLDFL